MTEPYVLDESGLLLPKPTGVPVTQIWIQHIGVIRVVDDIDDVVAALDTPPCKFIDLFGEPVYILQFATAVAVTKEWQDTEVIKLDMKEREIAKRLKERNLAQASFEAAKTGKPSRRFN